LNDSPAEVGKRIKLARLEQGWTQDELAALASFSKRSLQDYERGLTIPYRHIRELAELLRRPPSWFLHGDQVDADGRAGLARVEEGLSVILAAVRDLQQNLQRQP
jgi:transcriptional regulator with XRE-family HTH domain